MSGGNDVYLTDSIVEQGKLFFVQELDVSITAQGEDKLIHQREIKGVQKLGLSVAAHERTKPKPINDRLRRKKKCFKKSIV